jgi:hypothetical protein
MAVKTSASPTTPLAVRRRNPPLSYKSKSADAPMRFLSNAEERVGTTLKIGCKPNQN